MCAHTPPSPFTNSTPDIISTPFSSYLSKGDHQGVSIFCRKETSEQGHRGFRLFSLGVLLAKSSRPRPWRHVPSLKSLIHSTYSQFKKEGIYDPEQFDWSFAEGFFEQRKHSQASASDSSAWRGWSDELDAVGVDLARRLWKSLTRHSASAQSGILQPHNALTPPTSHSGVIDHYAVQTYPRSSANPDLYPSPSRGIWDPLPGRCRYVLRGSS